MEGPARIGLEGDDLTAIVDVERPHVSFKRVFVGIRWLGIRRIDRGHRPSIEQKAVWSSLGVNEVPKTPHRGR
jgi:hypothetical protein